MQPTDTQKLKFISLFSGIGGFDLGFERAGMECVAQVEIDKNCLELLANRFPNAERYTDVKEFHYGRSVDLICGGFPCQDLSIAGRREGLAGKRSGLWFEFARVIDELEPRWVVIENVPGLLSSDEGRDFAVILRWLVERGYGVSWRVFDAQYFGVPQRRRRVFVVASFGSGSSAKVLFESEGLRGNLETGSEIRQTDSISFTVRSGGDGGGQGYLESKGVAMALSGQPQYITTVSGNDVFPSLLANIGTKQWLGNQEAFSGDYFIDDPTGVRRLVPAECERLQGFPDGWTEGFADTVRYRMLGNAVAVPCAEWIGKQLLQVLSRNG